MEAIAGDDILKEKIKAYRESLNKSVPDLDIALLLRILDMVNDDSEVKVAISPVDPEGGWSSSAPTYAVLGTKTSDDGRIELRVNDQKHGIAADALYTQLKKALKHASGSGMPVFFTHKGEETKLTDVYSHSLVRNVYAGMPFDVVLATSQKESAEPAE